MAGLTYREEHRLGCRESTLCGQVLMNLAQIEEEEARRTELQGVTAHPRIPLHSHTSPSSSRPLMWTTPEEDTVDGFQIRSVPIPPDLLQRVNMRSASIRHFLHQRPQSYARDDVPQSSTHTGSPPPAKDSGPESDAVNALLSIRDATPWGNVPSESPATAFSCYFPMNSSQTPRAKKSKVLSQHSTVSLRRDLRKAFWPALPLQLHRSRLLKSAFRDVDDHWRAHMCGDKRPLVPRQTRPANVAIAHFINADQRWRDGKPSVLQNTRE